MQQKDMILVAIEDEQIQDLFKQALATAGYQMASAGDEKAIDQLLQEATPSLVILGQEIGGSDGIQIAGNLLERFPTLPILLFIDEYSSELLKNAIHVGISDCLLAPVNTDNIRRVIESSLQRANRLGDWTRREVRRTTASLQRRVDELQKFDTLLNQIEDGVIILDEKSNILLINPAARRTFGIRRDETLVGTKILDLISHPEIRALLTGGGNNILPRQEITFEDGRVLTVQLTTIPYVGSAITMQDITYLKQIDRQKNEFVSTVSHDLRSPLTAILGYVDLLERVGPINEQQREFVKRVQSSVQSITSLVNDLLELGRIEAGLDSQNELVPLDGILRSTLENASVPISEKRLEVNLDQQTTFPELRGNSIRLRQLLDNLVGNAIKYSPEGGQIWIEVEQQRGQLILRIEDTGPGIPPADQPHIFEKFYRASNVPKGVGGSGLGLSIVKSIVDSHHGRIWVESVLGQGTTFTVVLPIRSDQEEPGKKS